MYLFRREGGGDGHSALTAGKPFPLFFYPDHKTRKFGGLSESVFGVVASKLKLKWLKEG